MVAMANDGYYQQQQQAQASRGSHAGVLVQKLERWMFLYKVTTGLYMLDWWERCIFNAVFLVFLVVACYNSGHYLCRLGAGLVAWCGDDSASEFGSWVREGGLGGVGGGDGAGS